MAIMQLCVVRLWAMKGREAGQCQRDEKRLAEPQGGKETGAPKTWQGSKAAERIRKKGPQRRERPRRPCARVGCGWENGKRAGVPGCTMSEAAGAGGALW